MQAKHLSLENERLLYTSIAYYISVTGTMQNTSIRIFQKLVPTALLTHDKPHLKRNCSLSQSDQGKYNSR